MRLYTFTNMYLSSIQQGIQSLHVLGNMFVQYAPEAIRDGNGNDCMVTDDRYCQLYNWANDHKTVICLNGGYSENLHELIIRLADNENPFPWASFREGKDALDSALTSVGIILPPRIYDGAAAVRSMRTGTFELINWNRSRTIKFEEEQLSFEEQYTEWEANFMEELNKYGLAR